MEGKPLNKSHLDLLDIGLNTHAQIDDYISASEAKLITTQVRNQTGSTLTKGTVVYVSGASGNKPLIAKAQANSETTSSKAFGIVKADILNNQNGEAVFTGSLIGLDTLAYTEGTILWLSPTVAGGYTSIKPVAPNHAVFIGVVTRQHQNQGSIEVRIANGFELEELHNVLISNPQNKQVIAYDSADQLYKNITLAIADISGLQSAISAKQDTLISGTTIKTLENQSLLGSGNIDLTKSDVGLSNVDNTSDFNKPISTATQTALNSKENTSNKDQPSGYAGLDGSGKINPNQLPALAITDTFVINSQAAMLALTAEVGDVSVRTDLNKSFILKTSPATVLANWQELLTPTDTVTSVYGRSGAVTAQSGDYTADQITETTNNKILTAAERTKLSGIATGATANSTDSQLRDRTTHTGTQTSSTISDFATTVRGIVLTGLSLVTGGVISATDSILVALGKLQNQITSLDTSKQDTLVSGTNIKTLEGQSLLGSGNIDLTKSDVGLGNVDNTSDADKPISTATQTALNAKENTLNTDQKRKVTVSTSSPTGGADGDVWLQYTA